ncbi:hypothetical protein MHO82_24575 [Vibrio sp. Of7-15]|uniref:hypothetical protein n=1 Tax=Vibrio sp. Of7-15 TaxID=2724879 RepID=UPI001EF264B9|nr:hypothetical protein [Vibrio sp. Of7-15]MCG7500043.1 hypothetical protein [Vibrio sp. Of7-15]
MGFSVGGLWDDFTKYGTDLLDDVQEDISDLTGNVQDFFGSDLSTNPGVHTQPEPLKADNKGNAITRPQGGNWRQPAPQPMSQQTMLMVGGGVVLLLGVLVIAMKK